MPVIPVFVINLDRRPDRLASIKQRLEEEKLEWIRVDAVDGQSVASSLMDEVYLKASQEYPPTVGEMACALSHKMAWKAFLESDRQAMCVTEDDIFFTSDFSSLLSTDNWVTPDLGIIKLDDNGSFKRRLLLKELKTDTPAKSVELYQLWSRCLGAGAYIAHRKIVERMVLEYAYLSAPIDQHLFNPTFSTLLRRGLVTLALPPVVYHDHSGSNLQSDRVAKLSGADAKAIKLARRSENRRNLFWKAAALLRGARFHKAPPSSQVFSGDSHVSN